MTTKSEIQDLLRFLSQEAKIPLPTAMRKVKELQTASLTSPGQIANSDLKTISSIFTDDKLAKQVFNAAKKVCKKRSSMDNSSTQSPKRVKSSSVLEPLNPSDIEASLALPTTEVAENVLSQTILITNRAPLVLAFAVSLLKYTMPNQPLSSHLSLAQAVVSVNSRSKAMSIGLEKGNSAEEDGWGQGQPKVRVMGREVRVLKRWGYDWKAENKPSEEDKVKREENLEQNDGPSTQDQSTQSTIKAETTNDEEPALWGLDLEALRSSNGSAATVRRDANTSSGLPIYTAQSARSYILKAFASPAPSEDSKDPPKNKSVTAITAEKENNLAMLLKALDLLYGSWAHVLSTEELDRRAWAWYVHVRPDVQSGVAGWGGKGEVRLGEILGLRRKG